MHTTQRNRLVTTMPAKLRAYAGDTYYLETTEQLAALGVSPESFAWQHGLLLLKPDAIVARAVDTTLQWLRDNGFRVVAARRITTDRHLVRALWYYQWNIASAHRRRLADLLLAVSDSLLLVVTDDAEPLPTTVRLTDRKGPTAPATRRHGELRHLLGGDTYLLNMVHTADDPADVLRELGIYCGTADRKRLIDEVLVGTDRSAAAAHLGALVYAQAPARTFARDVAKRSILDQLLSDPALPGAIRDLAVDLDSPDPAWATLIDAVWQHDWPLDPWDVLVVGAAVLPMRTPGGTQTIGAATVSSWLRALDEAALDEIDTGVRDA